MPTPNQTLNMEQRWNRRSLIIEFTCPAHLIDSVEFCSKRNQADALRLALMGVVNLFIRDASGWRGFNGGPDGPEPPVPGEVTRVVFSPDSVRRPSFTFRGEKIPDKPGAKPVPILHGGLIYRDAEGWSIHT
jgi:hypothetical protein